MNIVVHKIHWIQIVPKIDQTSHHEKIEIGSVKSWNILILFNTDFTLVGIQCWKFPQVRQSIETICNPS